MSLQQTEQLYLLENRTPPATDLAYFWRKGSCGYTAKIDEAQRFTAAEADRIINGTQSSHRFVKHPLEQVEQAAFRVVYVEDLRKREGEPVL